MERCGPEPGSQPGTVVPSEWISLQQQRTLKVPPMQREIRGRSANSGPEPLTVEQRRGLPEIVADRYEKGSLLIISQNLVKRWHELTADPTIGDAIMHRAHRSELTGTYFNEEASPLAVQ